MRDPTGRHLVAHGPHKGEVVDLESIKNKLKIAKDRQGQAVFLAAYLASNKPNPSQACRESGIPYSQYRKWLKEDSEFVSQFEAMVEEFTDLAEAELFNRAVHGVDKPIIYQGEITGTFKEKSDALLALYVRGRRRGVYGRDIQVTGEGGGPIQHEVTLRLQEGRKRIAEQRKKLLEAQTIVEGVVVDHAEEAATDVSDDET